MTAKFFALLTNIGAAKLANATALGTRLEITHMAVGDGGGTLPTPSPAQTQLVNEQRRAALNMLTIDPINTSQIIAEQVIPEAEGGWWIREIGLLDKDGDLIAIANCAETYKPQLQEGSGRTQTIRMILIVSSTAAVTLKIDPSVVLATRQYVDKKTDDKAIEVKQYTDNLLIEHEKSRNHPDATLNAKGFTQLGSDINSDSEKLAATLKAVKKAVNAGVTAMSDHVRDDNPHDQYLQLTDGLALISKALPAGTIMEFSGTTVPSGFLTCPTAQTNLSRTSYASLFAAIGTTWGAGDGVTTFGMPWFPPNYAAVQASGNIGSSSVGEVISHTHTIGNMTTNVVSNSSSGSVWMNIAGALKTTNPTGGTANLAAGVRVMKCVKY
ncbi:phage tail protein [Yersinia bercovieri]|uniref:phage tail protein n=1 Tax=Yersinia bercovieri TaxID=634 RepID=UPI0005E5B8AD|nr:phage tail protein [Yersinia bercovieri]CFQ36807.1 tail fiber protein [Yersinia bercovieri]